MKNYILSNQTGEELKNIHKEAGEIRGEKSKYKQVSLI